MALLELHEVTASYGAIQALHGVSFEVQEGTVVALLGANGAGKTTTLRAISGTVRRTGEIIFNGDRITNRAPEDIARMGIAHVPEGRGTLSQFSVLDNLRLGAYIRRDTGIASDIDRVMQYFPRLKERRAQIAGTLSGGEQQMLAVARALMLRPKLMLLDEPSLGLAPLIVQEIFRIIREINSAERVTVLVVEQNVRLALRTAHEAYLLETGRIIRAGKSAELAQDESIRQSYLGV